MNGKIKSIIINPITKLVCWIATAAIIVAGSLSSDYVRAKFSVDKFSSTSIRKNSVRDMKINEFLRAAMFDLNADRGWIMMFHNGSATASGIPFKKFSCVYEVVRKGVSTEIQSVQDMPLSSMPDMVDFILKNPDPFEVVVSNLGPTYLRYTVEQQGIQYMVWHRLVMNDVVIGFVGFDWLKTPEKKQEQEYASVNKAAHLVEYQLQN